MKNYKELIVWQKAHAMTLAVTGPLVAFRERTLRFN